MPSGVPVSVPEYKCFGFNELIDPDGPMSDLSFVFIHDRNAVGYGDGRRTRKLLRGLS